MKYAEHKTPHIMIAAEIPVDLAARLRCAAAQANTTQRGLIVAALEKHLPKVRIVLDRAAGRDNA
jgi:hypothetical protein